METVVQMKPFELRPFDTAEGPGFWCVMVDGCSPMKVSAAVVPLLEALRTGKTPSQLYEALRAEGVAVSLEDVREAIRRLDQQGFLVNSPPAPGKSVLWFKIRLVRGDALARVVRPLRYLFAPAVLATGMVAAVAAAIWYFAVLAAPTPLEWSNGSWLGAGLYLITGFAHELGHVAAAARFGIRVPDVGFGVYILRPVLYCDLTEAWGLHRWQRMIINIGGIYFQLLFSTIFILLHSLRPTPALAVGIQLTLLSVLLNLNPSLRYDGFWILSDAMGLSNVHSRAVDTLKVLFLRLVGRRAEFEYEWKQLKPWVRRTYMIYTTVYIAAVLGAVGSALWILVAWALGAREAGWGDLSLFLVLLVSMGVQFAKGALDRVRREGRPLIRFGRRSA